jgi:hypothetical protein
MRIIYIVIAILLAIDNVFIRFKVGGISYDRLLEFILFFAFFSVYLAEIKNNSFFKKWNTFIIIFALLQLIINFKLVILGKIEFIYVYTAFIKCFSFLVFSFLFLLIAKKDIRYVNLIIFIHFFILIFAFLQHPLSPIASQMFEIKKMLFAAVEEAGALKRLHGEEVYIEGGYASRFRLSGPFNNSISFSYFAISSFIINFYMYLRYKKRMYLFFLGVLFIASLLSQTRSLLLAELFLVFGYLFFAPFKKHGLYKLALITAAVVSVFFIYTSKDLLSGSSTRLTTIGGNGQGDIRPKLWITGLYAIMNYPLGIGSEDYQEIKNEMFFKYGNSIILRMPSHNGLINVGFNYSILGYFVFFFFVAYLLKYANLLEPKYATFFKLALISYLLHTSFHNNFILDTDYPFLMVLMLIGVDWENHRNEKTNIENH